MRIVDRFKVIDIEENDGERRFVPIAVKDFAIENFEIAPRFHNNVKPGSAG